MCDFTTAGGAAQHLTAEQKEIVDKHNEYRRSVKPPASNMLEMVTLKENHLESVTRLDALFSAEVLHWACFLIVAPQKWNSEAAAKAQKWASHCSKNPAHSPKSSRMIGSMFTLANFLSKNKQTTPEVVSGLYYFI